MTPRSEGIKVTLQGLAVLNGVYGLKTLRIISIKEKKEDKTQGGRSLM